ncbi:MAG: hypothetical protein P8R48_10660 [Planctomycetota bacterium]|nr:hypothetical protein [Planctomycetota bacterium]
MVVPFIPIILAAISGAVVIHVAIRYFSEVVEWFRSRSHLKAADTANVAFTLKQALQSGKHGLVQGIFNETSSELVEAEVINCDRLDAELTRHHATQDLVIYQ